MNEEQYNKIIDNVKSILDINIVDKISQFRYKKVDGYYVIEVYVKNNIKAREIGDILINIEGYAKKCGYNVLVDFLRG